MNTFCASVSWRGCAGRVVHDSQSLVEELVDLSAHLVVQVDHRHLEVGVGAVVARATRRFGPSYFAFALFAVSVISAVAFLTSATAVWKASVFCALENAWDILPGKGGPEVVNLGHQLVASLDVQLCLVVSAPGQQRDQRHKYDDCDSCRQKLLHPDSFQRCQRGPYYFS